MSDHTAVTVVDKETGEVLPAFEMKSYLSTVTGQGAFAQQQQLAAAYDAACKALIGPNDVQRAEGREFKKKSAWRKLARHFNISVVTVKVETGYISEGHFLATVIARATAPWGQSFEEVGACCTDEAVGKRVITAADAIATASTRAANRAVSNLIAMGEVSAEEMNGRTDEPRAAAPRAAAPRQATQSTGAASGKSYPFGKHKGIPLAKISTNDLMGNMKWLQDNNAEKFKDLIADIVAECESRSPSPARQQAEVMRATFDDLPASLQDQDDGLPFD